MRLPRHPGESNLLIESVLKLSPRLAVFDCDGTLWSGDAGEGFFDWELRRGVVPEKWDGHAADRIVDVLAAVEERHTGDRVGVTAGAR